MNRIRVDFTGLPDVTNEIFYPLYTNNSRYLVLMGGGGSGKSVFATQKIIYRMISEQGSGKKPAHRILVLRKVAKTLRDSVFAELCNSIRQWGLSPLFKIPSGRSSELYIRCHNGNEIIFAGLDDVEKLKSIQGVTNIWIEEASELDAGDFRQLDIRLRGSTLYYKQIILTFNPIDINHWLKKEFFDVQKARSTTLRTNYLNNRFLDEAAIQVLLAFKDLDPYYYSVYALGEWGVYGKTIFPAAIVNQRISELRQRKPLKVGFFAFEYENDKIVDDSIRWVDDEDGFIKIYEEPKPRTPYVGGGDTAGEGSDHFTGQIGNNVTGDQAATLRHQFDEDLYSRQMYCLGRFYNKALLGVETNYSTFPVKELDRFGYSDQYVREVPDTFTGTVQKRYGFQTNKLTRPLIIANLVKEVREHPEQFHDLETLEEMLTFVRNEKGRPEAKEGSHDDLIMSEAIKRYISSQQSTVESEEEIEKPKKLIDQLGVKKKRR